MLDGVLVDASMFVLDDGDEMLLLIVTIVDGVDGQVVQFVFIFLLQIVTLVQQNTPESK